MKQYKTIEFTTGLFTGNIRASRLESQLNALGSQGWMLRTTISETRRMLMLFKREIHVLVFERDMLAQGTANAFTDVTSSVSSGGMRVLSQADLEKI